MTQTLIEEHLNHLYPFLMSIRYTTEREIINIDEFMISCKWILNYDKLQDARKISGLTAKSFNPHVAPRFLWCKDVFVALMPIETWDKFVDFLHLHDKRSWNSWTKLWCYVYFNCARHRGFSFSHSREQFAAALRMQEGTISARLIELEQNNFLMRTKYNADQGIARTYAIPKELRSKDLENYIDF